MPPAAVATYYNIGLPCSALSSHSFIDVMKFLDVYIDKFREIPTLRLQTIIHVGINNFVQSAVDNLFLFCLYLQLSVTQ